MNVKLNIIKIIMYIILILSLVLIGITFVNSLSFIISFGILAIFLPFCFKRPFLLVWGIFFIYSVWPYIQFYLKIYFPIGIFFIIILSLFYFSKLLHFFINKHKSDYEIMWVDILNIFILIFGLCLFIFANDRQFAFIGLRENFKMCFVFLFIRAIKPTATELRKFIKVFLIIAIIVSLYGIYQYFFDYYSLINKFGGVTQLGERYFGKADSLRGHLGARRAYSLFLNNFILAYYLMIALSMILIKAIISQNNKMNKTMIVFSYGIILCFILTFTRTAWMGFILGSLFIIILLRKLSEFKRLIIPVFLALIFYSVTIIFVPNDVKELLISRFFSIFSLNPKESSGHYEYLIKNIKLLVQYPFGIGLGKTTAYSGEIWTESSIFKVIIEMGIIPGVLYMIFFITTIVKGQYLYHKLKDNFEKELVLIALGLTVGYLSIGIVFPAWFPWFPTMVLWMFMAVIYNLLEKNEKRTLNNYS